MKEILEMLKFWIISGIVIVLTELFFEYVVNRDLDQGLIFLIGIPMLIIWMVYLRYLFKTLIKLLKL